MIQGNPYLSCLCLNPLSFPSFSKSIPLAENPRTFAGLQQSKLSKSAGILILLKFALINSNNKQHPHTLYCSFCRSLFILFVGLWALALCGWNFVIPFFFLAFGFPTFAKANFSGAGLISQTRDSGKGAGGKGARLADKVNTTQLPSRLVGNWKVY